MRFSGQYVLRPRDQIYGGSAGSVTPTPVAAYWDDFLTGSGTLNGRTAGGGLVAYTTIKDAAAAGGETVNALQVTTTGKGTVAGTAFNSNTHGYRNPTTNYDYVIYQILNATLRIEAHISASLAPFSGFTVTLNTPTFRPFVTGTGGTSVNIPNETGVTGDILEFETYNSAGTDWCRVWWNGRIIGSDGGNWTTGVFSLTAAGVPLTGRMGVRADVASACLDAMSGGDPSVVNRMRVVQFGRYVGVNGDGTVDWKVKFYYTQSVAPTVVKYRLKLQSDNSVVSSGTLSSLTIDAANKIGTGMIANFTPASLTTRYWVEIYQEGCVDTNGAAIEMIAKGAPAAFGSLVVTNGQSLQTQADGQTTVASAPTNGYFMLISGNIAEYARSNRAAVANGNAAYFYATSSTLNTGSKPMTYIASGVGGTSITTRGLGSTNDLAVEWAIQGSGSTKVAYWVHTDGQSDLGATSTYISTFTTLYQAKLASYGGTVILNPIAACHAYNDASVEAMRRAQGFEIPAAMAGVICGPHEIDLQHFVSGGVANDLHLEFVVANGYIEKTRREALLIDFLAGTRTVDPRGPELYAVSKTDNQTVVVTIKLNGYTGLQTSAGFAVSTGKTDQFDGGIRFGTAVGTPSGGTSNTITTRVAATGCSVGTPSGGFVDVTFTFPANSFPGTVYVGGPYGANPFNRSNVNSVNIDFANNASMLQGTYSTEPAVAIQPYWHSSGNDYFSAS